MGHYDDCYEQSAQERVANEFGTTYNEAEKRYRKANELRNKMLNTPVHSCPCTLLELQRLLNVDYYTKQGCSFIENLAAKYLFVG